MRGQTDPSPRNQPEGPSAATTPRPGPVQKAMAAKMTTRQHAMIDVHRRCSARCCTSAAAAIPWKFPGVWQCVESVQSAHLLQISTPPPFHPGRATSRAATQANTPLRPTAHHCSIKWRGAVAGGGDQVAIKGEVTCPSCALSPGPTSRLFFPDAP